MFSIITRGFLILLSGLFFLSSCQPHNPSIDWVFVEGGSFEQGKNQIIISPKGDTVTGFTSPHRMVEIDPFYISKYEITVKQFKAFCASTGRKMPEAPVENVYGQKVYYQWQDDHPMLATWD